ncbi:unnamed protein product [Fraxinus pennsylvanica]|uniref:Uncharacterized protein n=1 Tax=Fraxinus pennsylvanica TaxID=56036 RepID=A0AAD2EBH1_9LAMI|nr:unnamed protein product [Fraxinus pennsylvanica]
MAAAAARPLVTVQSLENDMATDGGSANSIPLPDVMKATIRPDQVTFMHGQISKNARQPYAVSKKAGHQTSVESWGTGRAIIKCEDFNTYKTLAKEELLGTGAGHLLDESPVRNFNPVTLIESAGASREFFRRPPWRQPSTRRKTSAHRFSFCTLVQCDG